MNGTSISVERSFDIDRPTMWTLWTDPVHVGQWFRPSLDEFGPTVAHVDARVGGPFRIEMTGLDGTVHVTAGEFVELVEHERLVCTWRWDGSADESLVTVTFRDDAPGTTVQITHSQLASEESADQHLKGWIGCLDSLARSFER
jgi:uncharacterized protein YndB with AHSA1/START domain